MRVSERVKAGIIRIRPHDPAEVDAVMAFQRTHFKPGNRRRSPECRRWLYDQNPHNPDEGPTFWVYRRDGEIVGQQAEIPFELQIEGERHLSAWAIDLMVHPQWRLRGLGPALVATMQEHRPIVCVLDASPEGYAVLTGSGYTDLGPMPVYRRPLDARRALELRRVPPWARTLAPLVAGVVRVADLGAAAATRLAGARLVPVERLDERVDEIWAAASAAYPAIAQRDLTALAWRIEQRPDRTRLQRYYLVRGKRTLGYAVLRPTESGGSQTVTVVDYLAPPRWVAPLLLAVGRAARRDGAVALTVRTRNRPADRALRAAGFSRRFNGHEWPIHHLVHCTDDARVCAVLHHGDNWFLSAADSDLEAAHPVRGPDDDDAAS